MASIDEALRQRIRAAGVKLAEAERQAQLTRAEYHSAIRRMHLAGASLREIADAVELSHQRVQQIVNDAGGSWWQRVWRTRHVRRDAVYTFCERPPSEVSKLIAGPNVYICDVCVRRAEQILTGKPSPTSRNPLAMASRMARCAFCGKWRGKHRPLVTGGTANACAACLRLCREILDDRGL